MSNVTVKDDELERLAFRLIDDFNNATVEDGELVGLDFDSHLQAIVGLCPCGGKRRPWTRKILNALHPDRCKHETLNPRFSNACIKVWQYGDTAPAE